MMQRIITTLFALAALLDRVAVAPKPIRWFILRLLLPIEPRIRHFVLQTGWEAGAIAFFLPDPPARDCPTSRAVAFNLADCFHAFAVALETLPKQLYARWRSCEAVQRALHSLSSRQDLLTALPGPLDVRASSPFIDTS